jgi:hypothetical protein
MIKYDKIKWQNKQPCTRKIAVSRGFLLGPEKNAAQPCSDSLCIIPACLCLSLPSLQIVSYFSRQNAVKSRSFPETQQQGDGHAHESSRSSFALTALVEGR